jgi:hypothetical protein
MFSLSQILKFSHKILNLPQKRLNRMKLQEHIICAQYHYLTGALFLGVLYEVIKDALFIGHVLPFVT